MDSELEKNHEQKAADQTTGNSESYGRPAGNYQREYRSVTGRRPRIQRPYNADRQTTPAVNDDNTFRPEGFGAGLSSSNGGYQPRQQGGYNRGGYNQQRGGYNRGGYNQQQGGYRPRYNQQQGEDGEQQQGGYQPRQQGGYQQRGGYNQ